MFGIRGITHPPPPIFVLREPLKKFFWEQEGGVYLNSAEWEFLATTIKGLEDVASGEIEELLGRRAEKIGEGKIKWSGKKEDALIANYLARSIHRVIILLVNEKFVDLTDIYEKFASIGYSSYIAPEQSFAVVTRRKGRHNFTSIDVSREVGRAIIDSYLKEKRVRLGVNLDKPDVIVRVYVSDDRVMGGVDTTGQVSLHRRGYRVYQHPASLKTTIAYGLLRIADWKFEESLVDPMCGGGTIPIEAALYARGIPPGKFRKTEFAFERLTFMDRSIFEKVKSKKLERKLNLKIVATDASGKHINGAIENAKSAGVLDSIEFSVADARRMDLDFDKIVANVPYGIRMGSIERIGKLYGEFINNLLKHEWRRLVVIVGSDIFLREAQGKLKLIDLREIMYGDLRTFICSYERL